MSNFDSSFSSSSGPFPFQSQPCSGRMVFTPHQKAELEEVFQKTKYPSRREKEAMSQLFGVPKNKIEVCIWPCFLLSTKSNFALLSQDVPSLKYSGWVLSLFVLGAIAVINCNGQLQQAKWFEKISSVPNRKFHRFQIKGRKFYRCIVCVNI